MTQAEADKIKLQANKKAKQNYERDVPAKEGSFDEISRRLDQSHKIFKLFAYDTAPLTEIQALLNKHNTSFIDIEFPPLQSSIHDPEEEFPIKQKIVWKRAKDFLSDQHGNPPQVFQKEIEPNDIKQG